MWPFKKKEFTLDQFGLSPEEKREINDFFNTFTTADGRRIGREAQTPAVLSGLVAHGLWNFAEQKIVAADFDYQSIHREALINKAVTAIKKAYAIDSLPIYLYDLANYLELVGKTLAADEALEAFLEAHDAYEPRSHDEIFLSKRDIEAAVADAKQKLGG